jgi:hypothetical protein
MGMKSTAAMSTSLTVVLRKWLISCFWPSMIVISFLGADTARAVSDENARIEALNKKYSNYKGYISAQMANEMINAIPKGTDQFEKCFSGQEVRNRYASARELIGYVG